MNKNKFLALIYADLFDYPLTDKELTQWQIKKNDTTLSEIRVQEREIETKAGIYYLKGRSKLVLQRKIKEKDSTLKISRAKIEIENLKKIPTIEAIFITGSVAANNSESKSDIDLMIFTRPGSLWLTRLLVITFLKIRGLYRSNNEVSGKFCTNLYLDTNHLSIKNRNLFVAHEVLLAKPIFDRKNWNQEWLTHNPWVKDYLPFEFATRLKLAPEPQNIEPTHWQIFLYPLEILSYLTQLIYMYPKITNEKIGLGYAFFHPNDLSVLIGERFRQRLVKLNK